MLKFKPSELKLLPNQGYCNLNYAVVKDGLKYHVREFKLLNMDRNLEFDIQKRVSKIGIAPKPYYLDKHYMVAEFVEGVHKDKLKKRDIKELAKVLKKLHFLNYQIGKSTLPRDVRHLKHGFKEELVLSHNDLNTKNIIFGKSVKLIDWEYAGVNDRYFDLASVILEYKLNRLEERYLFDMYGLKVNYKKLRAYKKIYKVLYKKWFEKLENGKLEFLD